MLRAIRHIVLSVIDFFHQPFSRWIDTQTFRYLACGGSGAALNIFVYFCTYHLMLPAHLAHNEEREKLAAITAYVVAFLISTPYGFLMSRYIVFQESNLRGRVQMFRYLMTVGACIVLTYIFGRFFHYTCGIYATPSNVLTNAVVALFSYMAQRFFTFKVKDTGLEGAGE